MLSSRLRVGFPAVVIWAVLAVGQAHGQYLNDLEISPAQPTESDAVIVWVHGDLVNACWGLAGNSVSGEGFERQVDVRFERVADICVQILIPFTDGAFLGELEPGVYEIAVMSHIGSPDWTDSLSTTFEVFSSEMPDPEELVDYLLGHAPDRPVGANANRDLTVDVADLVTAINASPESP